MVNVLQQATELKFVRLQEEVLNLLSLIASVIEGAFLPYFEELTQALYFLYEQTPVTDIEGQTLRGKAITTIGSMISALAQKRDEERVMKFTKEFLGKLIQLKDKKATLLKPEDPQIVAIS